MKNRTHISRNLIEAKEQLEKTIKALHEDEEFSEIELQLDLEHAYHHINFAWNIRDEDESKIVECSKKNFQKWSKFPIGELDEFE